MDAGSPSSVWWKFEEYEIVEGFVRPAAGARLFGFDPWETFRKVEGRYRTVETLWGQFAELSRQIQEDYGSNSATDPKVLEIILDWTRRFGLLGLLPNRVLTISLPPSYASSRESLGLAAQPEQALRTIVHPFYARLAGHWFVDQRPTPEMTLGNREWRPGEPALDNKIYETAFWDWVAVEVKTEATSAVLAPYFSGGIPAHAYPCPLSEEFWPVYQEPVSEWIETARLFSEHIQAISGELTQTDVSSVARNLRALWILNAIAGSEATFYDVVDRDNIQPTTITNSLLSTMAKMFFWDLQAKRRLFRCGTCGRLFVSNDLKARYCRPSCRSLTQTRRHRSRLKLHGPR